MSRSLLLIFSLFIIISCDNKKINDPIDYVEFEETDSILSFKIAEDLEIYNYCLRYYEDTTSQTEYLSLERYVNGYDPDEIVFFDIEKQEEIFRVPIHKQGPNAIEGGLNGHDFLYPNRIITSSKYLPILYITDFKGNLIDVIKITNETASYFDFTSFNNVTAMYYKNCIVVPQYTPFVSKFNFSDIPIALLIDTITKEIRESTIKYPILYDNDGLKAHNNSISCVSDGEKYVYSYAVLDSVLVTKDFETYSMSFAKSRYIETIIDEGLNFTSSMQKQLDKNREACYGNLIYDKYRKLYYRFCHFKDTKDNTYINLDYLMCRGEFSIIILDSEMNKIGETKFQRGKYAPKLFFVNKDGLWLSENNYERIGKDMNDNKLLFRCLKIKGIN